MPYQNAPTFLYKNKIMTTSACVTAKNACYTCSYTFYLHDLWAMMNLTVRRYLKAPHAGSGHDLRWRTLPGTQAATATRQAEWPFTLTRLVLTVLEVQFALFMCWLRRERSCTSIAMLVHDLTCLSQHLNSANCTSNVLEVLEVH